jgi:3-oxoacyl-[acyl-carrier-protein] synthase II
MNKRFAITGAGMLLSVGGNKGACFDALSRGISGDKPLQVFHAERFNVKRAYEISDRPEGGPDRPGRATDWLCAAIEEALREAGIAAEERRRMPAMIGTGLRELRSLELWRTAGSPFCAGDLHFGGALRDRAKVGGPAMTLSNACSASNFALGLAADGIALGGPQAVIVAGCDSITESMFGLADRANPVHAERLQPFDRDRKGVVLGEGAAAIVLESEEHAAARGAAPLAWLRGVGMSCDAYHETAPSHDGVARAMSDAHKRSGVSPEDIDLLMAHGTGTTLNDQNEIQAFKTVFGASAGRVMITGIKSMTGHTSGGSALASLIVAIESMREGRVPPTVGLTTPLEEGVGLDFVASEARRRGVRVAQINAFGFGGVNAVAIIERADHGS